MIKYQDVELEYYGLIKLTCECYTDEEGTTIQNVKFAEDYIQLFGVEVSIKSLPDNLVKAVLYQSEEIADDMEWVA